ncbi:hypothetical protein Q3G72_003945 [Acer saccharum]|nr:hypothetical protein Q3G72_003945 [Acer saccharum]
MAFSVARVLRKQRWWLQGKLELIQWMASLQIRREQLLLILAKGMHIPELVEDGINSESLRACPSQNPSEAVVIDVECNQVVWDLDEEFSRVLETGVTLGFNLNGSKESLREEPLNQEEEVVVDVDGNMVEWNVEAEISRVIETGAALGIDYGGKEEMIRGELQRREKEDDERLSEAARR